MRIFSSAAEIGLGVGKLVDHPVDRRHTFRICLVARN
jgi:hypothetical protein